MIVIWILAISGGIGGESYISILYNAQQVSQAFRDNGVDTQTPTVIWS